MNIQKDRLFSMYRTNYYTRSEQGLNIIGYIDNNMQVTLEFWLDNIEHAMLWKFAWMMQKYNKR